MTVWGELKRFVDFIAEDNCRGDYGSAWCQVIVLSVIFGFLTVMGTSLILFPGEAKGNPWVLGVVMLFCNLWIGYELYHMVMGYATWLTGNKAFKFHWSMRWRAYMYKEHATKAYFVEYSEWLHGQDPSWYNL